MQAIEILVDGDVAPLRPGIARVGAVEVEVGVVDDGPGQRVEVAVRNPSPRPVIVDRVGVRVDAAAGRVLEHGWQSWSVVRAAAPDDSRPQRASLPWWARSMLFADPSAAGQVVSGDQFLVTDGGAVGFLDGRHHLGTVQARPDGSCTAWALLDGVPIPARGERVLAPLWVAAGDPGERYRDLVERWAVVSRARAGAAAPTGWCSWYEFFAGVTPDDVRANLELATAHGLELVQIDDGYQAEVGDWLRGCDGWDQGAVAAVASAIRRAGARAGIWTAPFLVAEGGRVARDHPDWVLGRAMYNPVWWGGWACALDTTNPAVLDHLRAVFAALVGLGFDYHKIDFCYAAALPVRDGRPRADRSCTRAEALRRGLDAIRDAIGDDAFLLGCGCPFGPAVGAVDAMRVSPDVAPYWERRDAVPGIEEAAISARNAVGTSILRAPMHRRLWINDDDCLLLRPTGTELSPEHRRTLVDTVLGTGGFTMVSDDLTRYGADEWAVVQRLQSARSTVDAPVELVDPFADRVVVRSPAGDLVVDQDGLAGLLPRRG